MDNIIDRIEIGDYKVGGKIPSERTLANDYELTRGQVKKVIRKLVHRGYLQTSHGRGTFVIQRYIDEATNKIKLDKGGSNRLSTGIKFAGKTPSDRILVFKQLEDQAIAKIFQNKESTFYVLGRLRMADKTPVAVQYAYLPYSYFPDIEKQNFKVINLYDYLDFKEHLPIRFQNFLRMVKAKKIIADYLSIPEGTYVYQYIYKGYDLSNRLVEYTISYNRSDMSEISWICEND